MGSETIREGKRHSLSAFGKERDFRRAHPVPGTAGRDPQVLPPGGGMKSFAPDGEKEFETLGLFIFCGLSLVMAILKLANWNSPLAKPSRKGDKFFDHMGYNNLFRMNIFLIEKIGFHS